LLFGRPKHAIGPVFCEDHLSLVPECFIDDGRMLAGMGRDSWSGTAAELLRELSIRDRTEAEPSAWKTWPREPSSFGKRLQSAKTILRKIGTEVVIGRASDRRRTRTITLRKVEPSMCPQHPTKPDTLDGSDGSRAVTKVA